MSTQVSSATSGSIPEPPFLAAIQESYQSGARIQVVTGDTTGLFWDGTNYSTLDQLLIQSLGKKFTVLSLDSVGLGFFDSRQDANEFVSVYARAKQIEQGQKQPLKSPVRNFRLRESFDDPKFAEMLADDPPLPQKLEEIAKNKISQGKFDPLAAMAVLKEFFTAYAMVREKDPLIKPVCVIIRHAAALFPEKDWSNLDQEDRKRMVYFIDNLLGNSDFLKNQEMFVLINSSRSGINQHIFSAAGVNHVEVQLPDESQRLTFAQHYLSTVKNNKQLLEMGVESFAKITASLPLVNVKRLMDVVDLRGDKITSADVNAEIDKALKARIGNNVTFFQPDHGLDVVDEQREMCKLALDIILDCTDRETAIPGIMISGPNGGGKTWTGTALAKESGRVVIVLSNIKDSAYGGTEKIIEQIYLVARTFSNLMIFMDEADTKLGNVRNESQTHEVTRELYGRLAEMMSDPTLLGRVFWILMSCRLDKFGADIKDRFPVKFGIFDPEGEQRKSYIRKQFCRKHIELTDEELTSVVEKMVGLSNRNIGDMIKLYAGRLRRIPNLKVLDFLSGLNCQSSIGMERRLQALIAAQHCTFSSQLPESLKGKKSEEVQKEINDLKFMLGN